MAIYDEEFFAGGGLYPQAQGALMGVPPQSRGALIPFAPSDNGRPWPQPPQGPTSFGQFLHGMMMNGFQNSQAEAALRQAQAEQLRGETDLQRQLFQGGGMLGGPGGGLLGDTSNPDVVERLAKMRLISGKAGGAELMSLAERMRTQRQDRALTEGFRSSPGILGAGVTTDSPQGGALLSYMTGDQDFDRAALSGMNEALNSNARMTPQPITAPQPGLMAPLLTSPHVGPLAKSIQNQINTTPGGLPAQHWLTQFDKLAQFDQTAKNANPTRPFGGGATGGALEILTRDAPGYAAGTLSPEQERTFQAALAHYTQPSQYQNPDTGIIETRRPELPSFVQEAVRRRGGATAAPNPQPAPRPQPSPAAPQDKPSKTVWQLAPLTTGPIPAGAELLSRTPLVGDMVQAPQFTQARNFVPQLQRDLVRVLQNNPRYAEGERKAIEAEINIEGRMFDNSTAFRDRLVGIDNALAVRERNATATAISQNVGREERVQAMNVLNAIRQFRQNLGVPPRVSNDADWEALQPGTEYIAPNGKVKVKR